MDGVEIGIPPQNEPSDYVPANEDWLEQHFNASEILLEGTPQAVRVIDIDPPLKTSKIPVFIIGGYGTFSPLHNKANILAMAREGRRVLYVDEPRGIAHEQLPDPTEKPEKIEDYFLDQAAAIRVTMQEKGIAQAAIVAHSEGTIAAATAAYLHPQEICDLILIDPAGLSGSDTLGKLGARFVQEGIVNERNRDRSNMSAQALQQAKDGGAGFRKYLRSNIRRNISEGMAMASQSIRNLLMHAHNNGTSISIIHSVNDAVFPIIKPEKPAIKDITSKTPGWKRKVIDYLVSPGLGVQQQVNMSMIDGFYSVNDSHGAFINHPEEWTGMAHDALLAHERKRARVSGST